MLFEEATLFDKGVKLITTVRKNMKAMSLWDRAMLSKRFIIETIKTTGNRKCLKFVSTIKLNNMANVKAKRFDKINNETISKFFATLHENEVRFV